MGDPLTHGNEPKFRGWRKLSAEDLLLAYRKAKADLFFERSIPSAYKFVKFERDFNDLMKKLLNELRHVKDVDDIDIDSYVGDFLLAPKSIKIKTKEDDGEDSGHIYISNSARHVNYIKNRYSCDREFRILGDFPVETHILSALWINMIGRKLDACLSGNAYGARLRRLRSADGSSGPYRPYHVTAVGSFEPYFEPYKRWRANALDAIRRALENKKRVIAVTFDLKSYYHSIDPAFLAKEGFFQTLAQVLEQEAGEKIFVDGGVLNEHERKLNIFMTRILKAWSEKMGKIVLGDLRSAGSGGGKSFAAGLPIGLTASRVASNALLKLLDHYIEKSLSPLYYGRYVDDIILVVQDPGNITDAHEFMEFLHRHLGSCLRFRHLGGSSGSPGKRDKSRSDNADAEAYYEFYFGCDYQAESKIRLQPTKQKIFLLEGTAGLDFLNKIDKEFRENSSEFRLMPTREEIESHIARKVLIASRSDSEVADSLRRADDLSIRRLPWALYLRHMETLRRDLPAEEWEDIREKFFCFARDHILRADRIFDYIPYLPRLLGIAISLGDIRNFFKLLNVVEKSLSDLSYGNTYINGFKVQNHDASERKSHIDTNLDDFVAHMIYNAIIQYTKINIDTEINKEEVEDENVNRFLDDLLTPANESRLLERIKALHSEIFNEKSWYDLIKDAQLSDLGYIPFKDYILLIMNRLEHKNASTIRKCFKNCGLMSNDDFEKKEVWKEALKLENDVIKSEGMIALLYKGINAFIETQLIKKSNFYQMKDKWGGFSVIMKALLFPTRPFSAMEIRELLEATADGRDAKKGSRSGLVEGGEGKCEETIPQRWTEYVHAIRGVYVKPCTDRGSLSPNKERSGKKCEVRIVRVGTEKKRASVRVAIPSLLTDEKLWPAIAAGEEKALTWERYERLCKTVNTVIRMWPRPDYLILPELSLPRRWLDTMGRRLFDAGINLVAGTDYEHKEQKYRGQGVVSHACLLLADDSLGYRAARRIWQEKLTPAPDEERQLYSNFNLKWAGAGLDTLPYIYVHDGFSFGVMICSELLNAKRRVAFQGWVDALFVIAWNKDIDTFSSLLESAALDVHAYTVLVNNRLYGDSHARGPFKKRFERELARLRGGENDFCVTVTLDLRSLRAFQSRAKCWPEDDDRFKPVPEGFVIASYRKTLPS